MTAEQLAETHATMEAHVLAGDIEHLEAWLTIMARIEELRAHASQTG